MKIISLNTWGGIGGEENLINFFKEQQDTDVFCLQEIFNGGHDQPDEVGEGISEKIYDLLPKMQAVLPNHQVYFKPHLKDYYGLAMFVNKDIAVLEEGELFVYKEKGYVPTEQLGNHSRNIQYVTLTHFGKPLTIINFHGLWNGQGKTDTQDRLDQSKNILKFTESLKNEFILCGDFNLEPETESLKMLESSNMTNLIKKYNITSTRTSFYTKPVKFADYALVSQGVEVKDFKVLPDEVSDHAPLYVEIG